MRNQYIDVDELRERETQRFERKEYKQYDDNDIEQMRRHVVDAYTRYIPNENLEELVIPFGQEGTCGRGMVCAYIKECIDVNIRVQGKFKKAVVMYGFFCIISRIMAVLNNVKFAVRVHKKVEYFDTMYNVDYSPFVQTCPDVLPTMEEVLGSLMNVIAV